MKIFSENFLRLRVWHVEFEKSPQDDDFKKIVGNGYVIVEDGYGYVFKNVLSLCFKNGYTIMFCHYVLRMVIPLCFVMFCHVFRIMRMVIPLCFVMFCHVFRIMRMVIPLCFVIMF